MSFSLSEWGCAIDGAQEERKRLFEILIERVELREPPGTSWEFRDLKTKGRWFLPFGKRREFLIFKNKAFSDYEVRICADPYGKVLTVHSSMVAFKYDPEWRKKLSWEEQTVASDWATVIFRSCREACEQLMEELGGEKSRIKKEAKGILSVW